MRLARFPAVSLRGLALFILLATLLPPAAQASGPDTSSAFPAPPPPGAPTATVKLGATSGYIGQPIAVSGETTAPAPGVRIAWLYGESAATVEAGVFPAAGQKYMAQINVPLDAPLGPAEVCATVSGSADARFTCAAFTVTAVPTGGVTGIALDSAGTTFRLLDRSGATVASATIAPNGTFALSNITPGLYRGAIDGNVTRALSVDDIVVTSGDKTIAKLTQYGGQRYLDGTTCIAYSAKVTQLSLSPSHINGYGVVDMDTAGVVAKGIAGGLYKGPLPKPKPGATYDFGLYLSGVPLTTSLEAYVSQINGAAVDRVEYYWQTPKAAPVMLGSATAKPWKISFNVGQLPPGQVSIVAVPVVGGQQQCVTSKIAQMLASPMANPKFQPGATAVWDTQQNAYHFWGTMPNLGNILPLNFDTPSLPLVGVLENRLGAGVYVEGWLYQDGRLWFGALDADAYARLMSIDVYNKTLPLDPGGKLLGQWVAPQDFASIRHQTPRFPIASFRQELTLFSGPLFAIPPWVVVRASLSVGVGGDLTHSAVVYPLRPGLEVEVRPTISAWLGFSLAVDILFGIAGAEGTVQPGMSLALPLKANLEADPPVWFDDPCLGIFVRLIIKGRFLFWSWTMFDQAVVDEHFAPGCDAQQLAASWRAASLMPQASPAVVEAPAVAVDANGRGLMGYVEDAGAPQPAPRIMVRFKPAGSDLWGPAVAVTDGTRSVSDPVVAFAGPDQTPIVAWAQNNLTSGSPVAGDLGETLKQQEIYARLGAAAGWSTPVALTNDALGDGRPALAGDALGATLAWTRDTDGNLATRGDQRIAVREWTPPVAGGAGGWGQMQLLGGLASGGMNAQVSVARFAVVDPAGGGFGRRILAWTFDADADLNTNDDRRIAVATPNADGAWQANLLSDATLRADSPTVTLSAAEPETAQLAFLARGKDGDGQTHTGVVSNRAQLWTAQYSFADGSVRNTAPLPGEQGGPVYAERPQLSSAPSGETLLAFRQFGKPDSNAWLGQVALARRTAGGAAAATYSAPLLMTDEPRQNWQATIAISPANGQAVIAKIGSAPVLPVGAVGAEVQRQLRASSDTATGWSTLAVAGGTLSPGDAPTLDVIALGPEADPALDPHIALSQEHAAAGSSVTLTATLRNLGRNTVTESSVCFYRGAPGAGALVGCRSVPPLAFNARQDVSIGVTAAAGRQPMYAEIVTGAENARQANDRAFVELGALPAPEAIGAQEGTVYESSLAVRWLPVATPGVAGYRILRSVSAGGPYEVVGESTGGIFNDVAVERGRTYYYVVQVFDGAGVTSVLSREVGGALPPLTVYLPLLQR